MTTCAVPCKKKLKKMGKTFETRNIDVVSLHCDWWSQRDCWLHINFIVIRRTMLTSGKRLFYFGEKALLLRGSQKQGAKQRHRQRPRGWRSKESWLQFMNKPIPLSQQADSSPNKSGEQPRGQFSKLLPMQREQPRGQFSKLLPWVRGGAPKGQRGKKARSDDSVYFVA